MIVMIYSSSEHQSSLHAFLGTEREECLHVIRLIKSYQMCCFEQKLFICKMDDFHQHEGATPTIQVVNVGSANRLKNKKFSQFHEPMILQFYYCISSTIDWQEKRFKKLCEQIDC